jgi:hypothetical protein
MSASLRVTTWDQRPHTTRSKHIAFSTDEKTNLGNMHYPRIVVWARA